MSTTAHPEQATSTSAEPALTTLSVVMPNYNHAEYVPAALHAILSQQRQPDEIVIVDDGSTDDSRKVIECWAAREPRIRPIFNAKNIGAIASLNHGLRVARGRYVCLMAADDEAYPELFSIALNALSRHPDVALFCAEIIVHQADRPEQREDIRPIIRPSDRPRAFTPAETKALLRHNDNFVIPLAAVFRRDLILAEGGLDPLLGSMADGFMSKRLALKYGFCFAPKILGKWQVTNKGLSRTTSRAAEAVLALLQRARARIEEDPVFPRGYAILFERRFRFATCRLALAEVPPDWMFLQQVGPRGWSDRAALFVLKKLNAQLGALGALIWLALRLQPYSIPTVVQARLLRRRLRRTASLPPQFS
jgi:hypothetical protein